MTLDRCWTWCRPVKYCCMLPCIM